MESTAMVTIKAGLSKTTMWGVEGTAGKKENSERRGNTC
jgi:hypothetical protein